MVKISKDHERERFNFYQEPNELDWLIKHGRVEHDAEKETYTYRDGDSLYVFPDSCTELPFTFARFQPFGKPSGVMGIPHTPHPVRINSKTPEAL